MQAGTNASIADIKLGDIEFWERTESEREAAFARLRRECPISFHEEPDIPVLGKGPGFWSVTRYADVLEISRNADIYSLEELL